MTGMLAVFPIIATMAYSLSLIILTVLFEVEDFSEMYDGALKRFEDTPFSLHPRKTMHEARGPDEVYKWLAEVVVPMLYVEAPMDGDAYGMCTGAFPCSLGQGSAHTEGECAGSLVPGEHNCPSYIPGSRRCCEPCSSDDCPTITLETMRFNFPRSTKVTDLSANCAETTPSWLTDLKEWNRDSAFYDGAPTSAGLTHDYNPTYCPERESGVDEDITLAEPTLKRPLLVGTFNRALLGRLSLKRRKIIEHSSSKFQRAYSIEHGEEDTSTFGKDKKYSYQEDKGSRSEGAFVHLLDFEKSKDTILVELADLKANYWFDLQQHKLVLEVVFYNGNVNKFLVAMFSFEHLAVGLTRADVSAFPLDIMYFDFEDYKTVARAFTVAVICFLFCYFLKEEWELLVEGPKAYFTNCWTFLNMISLGTCACVLGLFAFLVLRPEYVMFKFPIGDSMAEKAAAMDMIGQSAIWMRHLMQIQSTNLLVAFLKLVTQGTALAPGFAMVFKVAGRKFPQIFAFGVTLLMCLIGFSTCASYWFGSRTNVFAGNWASYLQCLLMIMGLSNFKVLHEASYDLGAYYWILFQVTFWVVISLLQSVIICGYREERERLIHMTPEERRPYKRIARELWKSMSGFRQLWLKLGNIVETVLGSEPNLHVDENELGRLRDKRVHRSRHRIVTYDGIAEDEQGRILTPSNDFELKASNPYYLDGLMQYTVTWVKYEGKAFDSRISQGWRLTGVQFKDTSDDILDDFREYPRFKEKFGESERALRQWLAEQVDVHRSLTLHFTGPVQLYSTECVVSFLFTACWMLFAVLAAAPMKAYSLVHGIQGELTRSGYYEYNPMRESTYEDLRSRADVENWLENILVPTVYRCSTLLEAGDRHCDEEAASWSRAGFNLFAHSFESTGQLNSANDVVDLSVVPQQREQLSLGYVATEPNTTLDRVVVHLNHNVGALPLNHLRMTIKYACFEKNPFHRLFYGYPFRLSSEIAYEDCGVKDCMKTMPTSSPCYTSQGVEREDPHAVHGRWSGVDYNLVTAGSYRLTGGIVVGFGGTKAEAERVLDAIKRDHLLQKDVVGLAIQTVLYNTRTELFTDTTIDFSFNPTGKLSKNVHTATFPLNLMRSGRALGIDPAETSSMWRPLIFTITTVLAVLMIWEVIVDLYEQRAISMAMNRHRAQILYDYFAEDWWNVVQFALAFYIVRSYVAIVRTYLVDGSWDFSRLPVPFSSFSANRFDFNTTIGPDHVDEGNTFYKVSVHKVAMLNHCGVVFFLSVVHTIKYFNSVAPLQLILRTFTRAAGEIKNVCVITTLCLLGYLFNLHTSYGIQVPHMFGTVLGSARAVFFAMIKSFPITVLYEKDPVFFLGFMTSFCALFIYLPNMAFPAMLLAWQDTRRHAVKVNPARYVMKAQRRVTQLFRKVASDAGVAVATEEAELQWLDVDFWQSCSVLHHVHRLDKDGKLLKQPIPVEQRLRDAATASSSAAPAPPALPPPTKEHTKTTITLPGVTENPAPENGDTATWLEAVFHTIHMKRAVEVSSYLEPTRKDDDSVLGDRDGESSTLHSSSALPELRSGELLFTQAHHASQWGRSQVHEAAKPPRIPVVDHPVDTQLAVAMKKHLDSHLMEHDVAQELWLDALLTVLEYSGTIEKVRAFFVPAPMLFPKSELDKLVYKERLDLFMARLNMFYFWMQQEAALKLQSQTAAGALIKERVMMNQSIIMAEHLAEMDKQILEFRQEITSNGDFVKRYTDRLAPL